jgi:hypothetical protein
VTFGDVLRLITLGFFLDHGQTGSHTCVPRWQSVVLRFDAWFVGPKVYSVHQNKVRQDLLSGLYHFTCDSC